MPRSFLRIRHSVKSFMLLSLVFDVFYIRNLIAIKSHATSLLHDNDCCSSLGLTIFMVCIAIAEQLKLNCYKAFEYFLETVYQLDLGMPLHRNRMLSTHRMRYLFSRRRKSRILVPFLSSQSLDSFWERINSALVVFLSTSWFVIFRIANRSLYL